MIFFRNKSIATTAQVYRIPPSGDRASAMVRVRGAARACASCPGERRLRTGERRRLVPSRAARARHRPLPLRAAKSDRLRPTSGLPEPVGARTHSCQGVKARQAHGLGRRRHTMPGACEAAPPAGRVRFSVTPVVSPVCLPARRLRPCGRRRRRSISRVRPEPRRSSARCRSRERVPSAAPCSIRPVRRRPGQSGRAGGLRLCPRRSLRESPCRGTSRE